MCSDAGAGAPNLRWRPLCDGIERVAGRRLRNAYAPHSHDCYVVGLTAHGEQRFDYRRSGCCARPGEAYVLHPGETHDGRPGTREGYGYDSLYVPPQLVAEALGGGALPFVADAVSADAGLRAVLAQGLAMEPGDDLAVAGFAGELAAALARLAGRPLPRPRPRFAAMVRIRQELAASWRAPPAMAALEAAHGISRFAIAREFRAHFGVSPSRYVIERRLDHVRRRIAAGDGLAEAALAAGFSDQSHMTRHFRSANGLSPGRWRAVTCVQP